MILKRQKEVKWRFIKECFDIKRKMNFPFIPKITHKHIYVPPFGGKMKVKLAPQVFISSMAAAISYFSSASGLHQLNSEAFATSEFCNKINNRFYIVNSSQVKGK